MVIEEWTSTTIGDLCDRDHAHIQTGPFGSQLHAHEYSATGTPVIPTEGIGRRRILHDSLPCVPPDVAARLARHSLQAGDILFARRGIQATGLTALVTPKYEGAICGTGAILLRLDSDVLDSDFFSFYLSTPEVFNWLRANAVGAVMPNLNAAVIRRVPVRYPKLPQQRAIAHILGTLDDKIELNRRMNQTLEEMARALFKSWFVDFDPVRAKAEGREPVGMDGETAALFLDGFENSELGPIPKGWTVEPIGDAVRVVGGSTPSTAVSEFWEGGTVHWTTPRDLSNATSPVLIRTERMITEAGLSKISSGLLPQGTLLLSSRAPVGYLALAQMPIAVNQGYIAMPPGERLSNFFVLFWAYFNMDRIKARASGTTFAEISKRNFRPIPILVPPRTIVQRFSETVRPAFDRIVLNERESSMLSKTRDLLLSRLLSGELRIDHPERILKELIDE
ncbi:MAG: restriction endonuclease subunit S [bacterium]|nr:restriction endonuclease subunit S [bacterium]